MKRIWTPVCSTIATLLFALHMLCNNLIRSCWGKVTTCNSTILYVKPRVLVGGGGGLLTINLSKHYDNVYTILRPVIRLLHVPLWWPVFTTGLIYSYRRFILEKYISSNELIGFLLYLLCALGDVEKKCSQPPAVGFFLSTFGIYFIHFLNRCKIYT